MTGPLHRPALPGPRRRRALLVGGVVLAVAVAVAGTLVFVAGRATRDVSPPDTAAPALARYGPLEALLTRRGDAVVDHDRKAFMATVDPRASRFRRAQSRMFADLSRVRFASWDYAMSVAGRRPPADASRYDGDVWAPRDLTLGYRLAGFDARPTNLRQYPTFVQRQGHWYLASLSDYASRGLVSASDLWDYGPVSVVRRSDVLVLGPPSQHATMVGVAADVQTAVPQVTSVWGSDWPQRAVVLLPRTMREMALIDQDHEDLRDIAALTSAEIDDTAGNPAPVGDRITVNPRNWPKLSPLGQQVVLRHELTHVASESVTGSRMPTWLVEGLAEYVGFKFADVAVPAAASELQRAVRNGYLPSRLPPDAGFRGSAKQLAVNYEAAWLACRMIAERFGQTKLVRFYRAVGTSTMRPRAAVREALAGVLHLRLARLIALWRASMRLELA
ncbi:MAG TPA: hypothetical protein VHB69_08965 [Mycobacteriales bacterium]|nr:hypothetical protein [Mycobacteriales bacterium]